MPDLNVPWRGDLSLTPAGDLSLVDGSDQTEQHIIRRLFTAVRGYVWHQDYGAGLPQRIGRVARANTIAAIVRAQVLLEATVARVPVPVVTVTESQDTSGLFVIAIGYTDAITGAAAAISMEVPGAA